MALLMVATVLCTVASCGKKTYGQSKRKFKAWGMAPQHIEHN